MNTEEAAREAVARGAFTIYALVDPRDNAVRYIGCTLDLRQRFYAHLSAQMPSEGNRRRCEWVRELRALDLRPRLVVLDEQIGLRAAQASEQSIVRAGYALGWPLFNRKKTAGGGIATFNVSDMETRQ